MSRIRGEPTIQNHDEAVYYFSRLLIDLVLRELGKEHDPITAERLEEGIKHVQDIKSCQRPAIIRH